MPLSSSKTIKLKQKKKNWMKSVQSNLCFSSFDLSCWAKREEANEWCGMQETTFRMCQVTNSTPIYIRIKIWIDVHFSLFHTQIINPLPFLNASKRTMEKKIQYNRYRADRTFHMRLMLPMKKELRRLRKIAGINLFDIQNKQWSRRERVKKERVNERTSKRYTQRMRVKKPIELSCVRLNRCIYCIWASRLSGVCVYVCGNVCQTMKNQNPQSVSQSILCGQKTISQRTGSQNSETRNANRK